MTKSIIKKTNNSKKTKPNNLPTNFHLNDAEARKFLDVWDMLDDYVNQETALTSLFKQFPNNTNEEEVLLKCALLNSFYSAGIDTQDLMPLAEYIVALNIDADLAIGNYEVVEKLINCKGIKHYYSFASKYCNWHNQTEYPIYDQYVDDVLWALKQRGILKSFSKRKELKDYSTFARAVAEACAGIPSLQHSQNKVNFKLADRYLWLLGKMYFAKGRTVDDIKNAVKNSPLKSAVTIPNGQLSDNYKISVAYNGSIKVLINDAVATNVKATLRDLAGKIGFGYDDTWNTRHFGKKIIEYINKNNIK